MSNTELALQARADKAHLLALWQAVERLISSWAYQYIKTVETRLYDANDLIQIGFIAMVDALQGFDPEQSEFNTYLRFHIRRRFAEVAGNRSTKTHPEVSALSLDASLSEDGNTSRLDMLVDQDAHFAFDDVIEREAARQDCAVLLEEIDKLTYEQRRALMLSSDGLKLPVIAKVMNIPYCEARKHRDNAVRRVRQSKAGRKVCKTRYQDYIRHIGLSEFNATWTSATEWAVLANEKHEQYIAGEVKK